MAEYYVIGLMSGSSLDGLDVCAVKFNEENSRWKFEIQNTVCYEYPEHFQQALRQLPDATAYQLAEMHTGFARIQADYLQQFFQAFPDSRKADLIVSHGQTIFHQPEQSFTTQIGCGATLSALTSKTVVCDLRTYDVALGGQGAPLVPLGEKYLFPEFKSFLNIGGICNISEHTDSGITAYDVCPGNTLLNLLAIQSGKTYDTRGTIARNGSVCPELLAQLSSVDFYQKEGPKSLGTEHLMRDWWPLIEAASLSVEDKMTTVVEHIAIELGKVLTHPTTLITGGGALNTYLTERIIHHAVSEIIVPSRQIIEFKEALIIGFAGLERYLGRNNCLSSVTGAQRDNMGGAVYG